MKISNWQVITKSGKNFQFRMPCFKDKEEKMRIVNKISDEVGEDWEGTYLLETFEILPYV